MSFKPPVTFDFARPETWPTWRQRFLRYRTASKLDRESFDVQTSSLIYSMGEEAEKVYNTFVIVTTAPAAPGDPAITTFDDVVGMFDRHFTPEVNIIHERALFHQRVQHSGENIEMFVRELYKLSEHAAFQEKDSAIRDRLVVGLRDRELSEKLQLQPNLTLQQAITQARQHEQVKAQLLEQRPQVDAVQSVGHSFTHRGGSSSGSRGRGHSSRGGGSSFYGSPGQRGVSSQRGGPNQRRGFFRRGSARGSSGHSGSSDSAMCGHCGRQPHRSRAECPAYGKVCRKCGKYGHFGSVCRRTSRPSVDAIDTDIPIDPETTYFLGMVDFISEPPWLTSLNICGVDCQFKIDTGADTSIMSHDQFLSLPNTPKLLPTNAVLRSPGGRLDCLGQFTALIHKKGHTFPLRIFVVNADTDNLLSREAAHKLGLVTRTQHLDSIKRSPFGSLDSNPVKCAPVKIVLKENSQPHSITTARKVPIPLIGKVEDELKRMLKTGIIEEITEPTDWCAPMVAVMKKSGDVRICTDFKHLNNAIKRERYPIPSLEDILHKLQGAKVFSQLDATSGFYQLPLDPDTAKLTTFITPSGRFYYKRLPFGISSAPEIFQRTMDTILQGQENVFCYFDNILIFSKDAESHEKHLAAAINKIQEAGLKLNKEKCIFRKEEMEFLGYIISSAGVKPDPQKVESVINMPDPQDVSELKRILGMINFMGRFVPNLSAILRPVTELLEKDKAWTWDVPQRQALSEAKRLLTEAPTLAYFDLSKPTIVSADASSYGLGGVLMQQHGEERKPIAFCSRTLTAAERGYAQIEKECLASVWACQKFERYLVGLQHFVLETDHKPLVPLINTKDLQDTPVRCQRLLMRLMRFSPTAQYAPGKSLIIADTLSRSPQPLESSSNPSSQTFPVRQLVEDVSLHVDAVQSSWPASDKKLEEIASQSRQDPIISSAMLYTINGWPRYASEVNSDLKDYYSLRGELSVHQGLLIRGSRIVIPTAMREEILEKVHAGHLGITKCRERARSSVWWPGISSEIVRKVELCSHCERHKPTQKSEPLRPSPIPERPWQRLGADLCTFKGQEYLVIVDYFSRWIEILPLQSASSTTVIKQLKTVFATHGIPETLVTDNGTQFTSSEFRSFTQAWNILHVTSSPYFAQANGAAERAVQTAKNILRQDDPSLALLSYRTTPTGPTGVSPAELAMGRRLRTTLPTLPSKLEPKNYDKLAVSQQDAKAKENNKKYFDLRTGAKTHSQLSPGDKVLQKLDHQKQWCNPATILNKTAPHSYIIQTPSGDTYRRNRKHLRPRFSQADRNDITATPYLSHTPPVAVFPTPAHQPAYIARKTPDVAPTSTSPEPAFQSPPPAPVANTPTKSMSNSSSLTSAVTTPIRTTSSGRVVRTPPRFKD